MHDKQTQANRHHSTFWRTPNIAPPPPAQSLLCVGSGESCQLISFHLLQQICGDLHAYKFNFKNSTLESEMGSLGTGGLD